jgi:hypothetical protein
MNYPIYSSETSALSELFDVTTRNVVLFIVTAVNILDRAVSCRYSVSQYYCSVWTVKYIS